MLATVQSLEPAGVGARNLGECIALQLRQLDPRHPGARHRDPGGARASGSGRRPAARAAAPPAALQRERSGNGARAGALLPSAPRRRGQSGAGRVRHSRCLRAPHRSRLDRRDQPGDRAARARQPELCQPDFARARSCHAAHPAAGGALADAQPGNPQRDADQGGALHRAAPDQLFRASARRRWSR